MKRQGKTIMKIYLNADIQWCDQTTIYQTPVNLEPTFEKMSNWKYRDQ